MPNDPVDDRAELIGALLLEAGRLMEDASPIFALRMPDAWEETRARVILLDAVANDLRALASAAAALLRRIPE